MFSIFDLAAILLTLSAALGWINRRFLLLPNAIGMLVMSVAVSVLLVLADFIFPGQDIYAGLAQALEQIDFTAIVMNVLLAFLLFAGSLHIDLHRLRKRALPVILLAVLGTLISTAVVAIGVWGAADLIGYSLPFAWALVFGALISPTDPVAVLSTLKSVNVPADLEVELQGESLFNDGVGIVLFLIALRLALGGGDPKADPGAAVELLLLEAGGGLLLGCITGFVAYRAIRAIDDYPVEVLISLALVTGTYAIAQQLHVSGPLSVVAAGLLFGDRGARYGMSDKTQTYLFGLWTLIDEILNAVLFLLIGLEVLVLRFDALSLLVAAAAIPIVLFGRLLAVGTPPLLFPIGRLMSLYNVPFLTWAGIRGGISVALALAIPPGPTRPAILAATYGVVLFSIVVQGGTLAFVARKMGLGGEMSARRS